MQPKGKRPDSSKMIPQWRTERNFTNPFTVKRQAEKAATLEASKSWLDIHLRNRRNRRWSSPGSVKNKKPSTQTSWILIIAVKPLVLLVHLQERRRVNNSPSVPTPELNQGPAPGQRLRSSLPQVIKESIEEDQLLHQRRREKQHVMLLPVSKSALMKFQIGEQSQPSYVRSLLQSHLLLEDQPQHATKRTRIQNI